MRGDKGEKNHAKTKQKENPFWNQKRQTLQEEKKEFDIHIQGENVLIVKIYGLTLLQRERLPNEKQIKQK